MQQKQIPGRLFSKFVAIKVMVYVLSRLHRLYIDLMFDSSACYYPAVVVARFWFAWQLIM